MTTQSPDQSLSQSPAPSKAGTPLTDAEYASWPVLDTQTGGEAVRIQFARKLERDYGAEILALEEENRKLRGQIVSQPPAPSEEMEERIKRIADDVAQRNTSTVEAHYLVEDSAIEAMESLAAELGKEREAELAEVKALAQLFGKQEYINRLPADWFEDSSLETWFPLTAQTFKELKRELAEAREKLALLDQTNAELNEELSAFNRAFETCEHGHGLQTECYGCQRDTARKESEDLRAQLLALSAAYQRQKEALERCKRSAEREIAICEGLGHASAYWPDLLATIIAALAETPDVSMWKPIDSAPKDGTRILALWPYSKTQCWFETFWDDDESQGDKPGWYAPEWGCLLDGYNPTHWQPLPPPLTLQPDHQK